MSDLALSAHFTLSEFTRSREAQLYGFDNDPPAHVVVELRRLCHTVLEPLRALLGGDPLKVASGYRSPAVNEAVGGAPNSDHRWGRAADIYSIAVAPTELATRLARSGLPTRLVILEYGLVTHVSIEADVITTPSWIAQTWTRDPETLARLTHPGIRHPTTNEVLA